MQDNTGSPIQENTGVRASSSTGLTHASPNLEYTARLKSLIRQQIRIEKKIASQSFGTMSYDGQWHISLHLDFDFNFLCFRNEGPQMRAICTHFQYPPFLLIFSLYD